jgi:predicted nucleic acid-binding protein
MEYLPGGSVPDLACVSVRHVEPHQVEAIAEQATPDPGESEVLALALGSGGLVVPVLDDLDARRHAERYGIRKTGTLGVIVELHQRGFAADTIEADLERLRSAGHWLGGRLAASAIERVRHSQFVDRPSNPRPHRVRPTRVHWPVHRKPPGPGPRDAGR